MTDTLNSLDLTGRQQDTRVVVAMSGGVDSSVVAGLLAREGYDVVGMTLQLYDHGQAAKRKGACCAGQDIHDARRVAERLGIPHYVLDYEAKFREQVINPFMESYIAGETPIPCVACNQTVKFADLLSMSKELGAAALATGHYVRSRLLDPKTGQRALYRPHDASRDQSYFLFATTQEQVDYLRFPLGDLPKSRTREIAHELGLDVAGKPDSQDICFVPQGRYSDVISRFRPSAERPGKIVHLDGRVLGEHRGILNFTIGQRRGIGIATGEPIYVIQIDAATDRVIIGPKEALETRSLILRDINWLGDGKFSDLPDDGIDIVAKVRSTHPPVACTLKPHCEGGLVELHSGEDGISPGQACVFYEDQGEASRILGGGFIKRSERTREIETMLDALISKSAVTDTSVHPA